MEGLLKAILKLIGIVNEQPSYIWDDTVNNLVYLCYAERDNIIETDSKWKVQVINKSVTNHYSFKKTSTKFYNVAICNTTPISSANIENTLTTLYNSGIFEYKSKM